MGAITDALAAAFRDYVTTGVPASGAHEPVKSEIRALGPLIESAIGSTTLASVDVTKTTKSLLDADLAHDADSTALVYADSTDANNDLYIKVGTSGSGSWTNTHALYNAVNARVDDAIDENVTINGLASLTEPATSLLGRQTDPANGTTTGGGTVVDVNPFPSDGRITAAKIYGGTSNGTVTLRLFQREDDGITFTAVGDSLVLNVTANTLNTFADLDLAVINPDKTKTLHLGHWPSNAAVDYITEPSAVGGFYATAGDQPVSFVDADGPAGQEIQHQWQFTFEGVKIREDTLVVATAPAADGNDRILRTFETPDGIVRASIGFQNVDTHDPQAGFFRVYAGDALSSWDFTPYQYGCAVVGRGLQGETFEMQLASDDDPTLSPEFSIRHRVGGAVGDNLGSRIQTRNSADTVGFGLNFRVDSDPHLWLEDSGDTPATLGIYHPKSTGAIVSKIGGVERMRIHSTGIFVANSSEPATPTGGGVLFVEAGALKFKGSGGTVTTLGPA
jgi:hypothetical protein